MKEKSNCVTKIASMFLFIAAISLVRTAQAGPRITGFSNSKTSDARMMFLVKPGEKLTFSVQVEGAKTFEWTV
ncbi:MAG: hypothetical protein KAV00_15285, partial [Phycisphaerae bacterium]|nr:hypothetical protein [Phycisphaerae bacterium]